MTLTCLLRVTLSRYIYDMLPPLNTQPQLELFRLIQYLISRTTCQDDIDLFTTRNIMLLYS